jgi:two-component system response regulator AtoC
LKDTIWKRSRNSSAESLCINLSTLLADEGAQALAERTNQSKRVLIVSNEPAALGLLQADGMMNGYRVETTVSGWEALERVQSGVGPDLVILAAADTEALHTLRWLRRVRPDLSIVLVSRHENAEHRKEAMRAGAQDYLVCSHAEQSWDTVICDYLSSDQRTITEIAPEHIVHIGDDMFFVAASPAMHRVRSQAELLAQVNGPVLIEGPAGSGKEFVARLIHKLSVRSGFRFVKVSCAALTGDLLDAELFGYDRDSTVNGQNTSSKLELCQPGTLFLDEITAVPLSLQEKMLRGLREGFFANKGTANRVQLDIRIVAATAMNIDQAVAEKKLREDLYYHLSAFTVHVPPLRQRRDEIPLLLGHFMNQLSKRYGLPPRGFSGAVMEACQCYTWPGNLNQLESFVKRYLVAGETGNELALDRNGDGPTEISHGAASDVVSVNVTPFKSINCEQSNFGLKSLLQSVKGEAEKNAIATALEQTHWNRKAAARLLKVSYRSLLYKIQQYHISPPEYSSPQLTGNGWIG